VGVEIVLETLRNSLFTGSIYILLGVGLTLIYKILNFANFSHGELIVTGPYAIVFALPSVIVILDPLIDFLGSIPIMSSFYSLLESIPILGTVFLALEDIPVFGSIVTIIKTVPESFYVLLIVDLMVTFLVSGILALVIDFLVFRPLRARNATPMTLMIASIGVSFIIRSLLSNTYGTIQRVLRIEGQPRLNEIKIIVIVCALLFAIILDLVITRTKLGKAMRAMADNPDLAQASGISKGSIIAIVWIIGAGFAGMGGALKFLANTPLTPTKGFLLLLPTFAVIILGGIGSYRGTIVAAYILGIAENFGTFLLTQLRVGTFNQIVLEIPILLGNLKLAVFRIEPSFKGEYQIAIGFLILVMVLLIKPSGLFGEETAKDR
jgi:branched-subunit amino acid ABC-type transport system permease component